MSHAEWYAAWREMSPVERVIDRAVDAYIRYYFVAGYLSGGGLQRTKTQKAKQIEYHELHLLIEVLEADFEWHPGPAGPLTEAKVEAAIRERALARRAEVPS